ncbi:MAG: dihydropteroate synthase [Selenomonadaceae bacterium]|nr:dihydropteroate synthase [Selenomonadaceae bacterium]
MKTYEYNFKNGKKMVLGKDPLVMGILNVTPDSFYDGGHYETVEAAVKQAKKYEADGADIIDIGAESTRPKAKPLTAKEEGTRLFPILEEILRAVKVPVSIDTYHATTAEKALKMGVNFINDVNFNDSMARVAAKYNVPVVVMARNTKGKPEKTRQNFVKLINIAKESGVSPENIILDPGIGFIGGADADTEALRNLKGINKIDGEEYPLLVGLSRKSFLGKITGRNAVDLLAGTMAANALAILCGANILRVHDVKEIVDVIAIVEKVKKQYNVESLDDI